MKCTQKKDKNILSAPFAINGFMDDITHRKSNPLELKHLIKNQQSFKGSLLQNSTQNSQQGKLQLTDAYLLHALVQDGFYKVLQRNHSKHH